MPSPSLRLLFGLVALGAVARAAAAEGPDSTESKSPRTSGAPATLLFVPGDVYSGALPPVTGVGDAEELWKHMPAVVARGDVSAAIRLAARVVAADPDHAGARRLLGYQRVGDQWAGGYAARELAAGKEWDPRFGWIQTGDGPRYAAGERPWGNRWITAAEDAGRHAALDRGWQVRTDHVMVQTNHSREAAVEFAVRLETLHHVWRQLFGEFELPAAELQARLDGKQPTGYRRKPFRVFYHRDRAAYNAALAPRQPQIEVTLGIYFDRERESHFFAGPDQDRGTIDHEAVHQFFEEANTGGRRPGATSNAWAIEGIACYFESLIALGEPGRRPTAFAIGAASEGRLPAARQRRLVDDYYVPLAELAPLAMADLQKRTDLPQLYSQSAGLAAFLMDGAEGAYRKPFAELLKRIYAGQDKPDTLSELTGKSYGELDREYREFLATLPAGE
ncbi:MAG: hypothetical protein KF688_08305 [Pirellulales bacterium]|nr:hypothetical protein [Pirellulales bacterium]